MKRRIRTANSYLEHLHSQGNITKSKFELPPVHIGQRAEQHLQTEQHARQ